MRRSGNAEPAVSYPSEYVSGNYFSMFGVPPHAGRTLAPRDDEKGAAPVAMMSYRLWQEKYGRDPAMIGSTFHFNNEPHTIVGITPPGFYGDQLCNPPPDFFLPLHAAEAYLTTPNQYWLDCTDPAEALRGSGRTTARTGSLSRKTLVVVQTALSLALMSAAGLLTMTLYRLENQNFGFKQDGRLVVNTDPRQAG